MLSLSGTNVLIRLPRQDRKHIFPFSMRYTPAIHRTGESPVSPIIRIPAIAERIQRIHCRRQAVGFTIELHTRYNQFYPLHAIRVNSYNCVDIGRQAVQNMPIIAYILVLNAIWCNSHALSHRPRLSRLFQIIGHALRPVTEFCLAHIQIP